MDGNTHTHLVEKIILRLDVTSLDTQPHLMQLLHLTSRSPLYRTLAYDESAYTILINPFFGYGILIIY